MAGKDNPNSAPKDFVIEYWDDTAWVQALSVTGETGWASTESRIFNISGSGASASRRVVFVCT
jgi:hypothetical protein